MSVLLTSGLWAAASSSLVDWKSNFDQGVQHFDNGKYRESSVFFNRALSDAPWQERPEIRSFIAVAALRNPFLATKIKLRIAIAQINWLRLHCQRPGFGLDYLPKVMEYIENEKNRAVGPQCTTLLKETPGRRYAKDFFRQKERYVLAQRRGVQLVSCPTCPWSFFSLVRHKCNFR